MLDIPRMVVYYGGITKEIGKAQNPMTTKSLTPFHSAQVNLEKATNGELHIKNLGNDTYEVYSPEFSQTFTGLENLQSFVTLTMYLKNITK